MHEGRIRVVWFLICWVWAQFAIFGATLLEHGPDVGAVMGFQVAMAVVYPLFIGSMEMWPSALGGEPPDG